VLLYHDLFSIVHRSNNPCLPQAGNKSLTFYASNIESLETKRNEIREMLNMIVVQQRNLQFDIDGLSKEAEELAIELINDLKKEHHIK
jgi:hypothetical protein